jgi:hypothetical protein
MTAADINALAERATHPGRSGDLLIGSDGRAEDWLPARPLLTTTSPAKYPLTTTSPAKYPLTTTSLARYPLTTAARRPIIIFSTSCASRAAFFSALLAAMNREMTREE